MVSIKFSTARIESLFGKDYLLLELDYSSRWQAIKFVNEIMKAGKTYLAEIKLFRSKRSTEANSKAWKLIGEIAKELGLNPIDVYRRHVEEVGKIDQYLMIEAAYAEFDKAWVYDHIGRYSRIIGESREKPGYIWVAAFHGSSSFDTKEMHHFVDNIIQECKQIGVEHLSPDEVDALVSRWEKKGDT